MPRTSLKTRRNGREIAQWALSYAEFLQNKMSTLHEEKYQIGRGKSFKKVLIQGAMALFAITGVSRGRNNIGKWKSPDYKEAMQEVKNTVFGDPIFNTPKGKELVYYVHELAGTKYELAKHLEDGDNVDMIDDKWINKSDILGESIASQSDVIDNFIQKHFNSNRTIYNETLAHEGYDDIFKALDKYNHDMTLTETIKRIIVDILYALRANPMQTLGALGGTSAVIAVLSWISKKVPKPVGTILKTVIAILKLSNKSDKKKSDKKKSDKPNKSDGATKELTDDQLDKLPLAELIDYYVKQFPKEKAYLLQTPEGKLLQYDIQNIDIGNARKTREACRKLKRFMEKQLKSIRKVEAKALLDKKASSLWGGPTGLDGKTAKELRKKYAPYINIPANLKKAQLYSYLSMALLTAGMGASAISYMI